jgi:hypothetical protein
MPEQCSKVTLPGEMYQRVGRWWWRVQLPGENRTKARPLKPAGARAAARDRDIAEKAALEMWERAITQGGARQITLECTQKVERLKAQFLDKVRHLTEIVEAATAKAQAEAQARAEAETRLGAMIQTLEQKAQDAGRNGGSAPSGRQPSCETDVPPQPQTAWVETPSQGRIPQSQTGICACCGASEVPAIHLKRIDSGQLLCPDCLNALRLDISRIESRVVSDSQA